MAPKLRTFYAFIALLTLCAGVVAQGKAPDTAPEHLRCADNRKIILSCKTAKNRLLQLCDAGDSVIYSYGRFNEKPQLTFANKKINIEWMKLPRDADIWGYLIPMLNGKTFLYEVSATGKGPELSKFDVTVMNTTNNKELTSDQCKIDVDNRVIFDISPL